MAGRDLHRNWLNPNHSGNPTLIWKEKANYQGMRVAHVQLGGGAKGRTWGGRPAGQEGVGADCERGIKRR